MLSKKLKRLLKSTPATVGLIKYLEDLEAKIDGSTPSQSNNSSIVEYDDSLIWTALGIDKEDVNNNDFVPLAQRSGSVDISESLEQLLDTAIEEENFKDLSFKISLDGAYSSGNTVTLVNDNHEYTSSTTGSAGGCTIKNVEIGNYIIHVNDGIGCKITNINGTSMDSYTGEITVDDDNTLFEIGATAFK